MKSKKAETPPFFPKNKSKLAKPEPKFNGYFRKAEYRNFFVAVLFSIT